ESGRLVVTMCLRFFHTARLLDPERPRADGLPVEKDFGAVLPRRESPGVLKRKVGGRNIAVRHALLWLTHDVSAERPADAEGSRAAAHRQDRQVDRVALPED